MLRRFPQFPKGALLISHLISFGQAVYTQQNTVRIHYLDQNPLLIFRFLYRKRGAVFVTKPYHF